MCVVLSSFSVCACSDLVPHSTEDVGLDFVGLYVFD